MDITFNTSEGVFNYRVCAVILHAEKILAMPGGPPDHVSAYQLSVEPDTALDSLLRKGHYREADEETCGTQYGILCDVLGDAGYHHYEVSNFALPGKEAAHDQDQSA